MLWCQTNKTRAASVRPLHYINSCPARTAAQLHSCQDSCTAARWRRRERHYHHGVPVNSDGAKIRHRVRGVSVPGGVTTSHRARSYGPLDLAQRWPVPPGRQCDRATSMVIRFGQRITYFRNKGYNQGLLESHPFNLHCFIWGAATRGTSNLQNKSLPSL